MRASIIAIELEVTGCVSQRHVAKHLYKVVQAFGANREVIRPMPKPSKRLYLSHIYWPYISVDYHGAAFRCIADDKVEQNVITIHCPVNEMKNFCWELCVHRLVLFVIEEASRQHQ